MDGKNQIPQAENNRNPAIQMPDKEMRDLVQKGWENAREIIRNENDLINHRIGTFTTLQGFLFAALGIGLTQFLTILTKTTDMTTLQVCILIAICGSFETLICVMGFVTSRLAEPGIRAAKRQISAASVWWESFRDAPVYRFYAVVFPFPPVVGKPADSYSLLPLKKTKKTTDKPYDLDIGSKQAREADTRTTASAEAGLFKLPTILSVVWRYGTYISIISTVGIIAVVNYGGIFSFSNQKLVYNQVLSKIEELKKDSGKLSQQFQDEINNKLNNNQASFENALKNNEKNIKNELDNFNKTFQDFSMNTDKRLQKLEKQLSSQEIEKKSTKPAGQQHPHRDKGQQRHR